MYVKQQGEFQENKLSRETPSLAARKQRRSQPASQQKCQPSWIFPWLWPESQSTEGCGREARANGTPGAFVSPGSRGGKVNALGSASSSDLQGAVVVDLEIPESHPATWAACLPFCWVCLVARTRAARLQAVPRQSPSCEVISNASLCVSSEKGWEKYRWNERHYFE